MAENNQWASGRAVRDNPVLRAGKEKVIIKEKPDLQKESEDMRNGCKRTGYESGGENQ